MVFYDICFSYSKHFRIIKVDIVLTRYFSSGRCFDYTRYYAKVLCEKNSLGGVINVQGIWY